jgi:hypothetical protein
MDWSLVNLVQPAWPSNNYASLILVDLGNSLESIRKMDDDLVCKLVVTTCKSFVIVRS